MAIFTPLFTVSPATQYNMPNANEYATGYSYTSVPLEMANGYTQWQTFVQYGGVAPGLIQRFTLAWPKLTAAELASLLTVYAALNNSTTVTLRSPDNNNYLVHLDPDNRTIDVTTFVVGGATMYYRASIHLIKDVA